MVRTLGLRAQLLLGLSAILLVVVISVGLISLWASKSRGARARLDAHTRLGRAAATLLSPALVDGHPGRVARVVGELAPLANAIAVFGRGPAKQPQLLVGDALGRDPDEQTLLKRSLLTQEQLTLRRQTPRPSLLVATPIFVASRAVGVVLLRFPEEPVLAALPWLYWPLMVLDGLVLLLFVYVMITRTVAGPLQDLERGAAEVADGRLDVHLEPRGARELASLVVSFNAMTGALREQVRRLEEQRQSLIRSEKLASVGRLAAGVAHEVGNPLQAIIGFTDILLTTSPSAERQHDALSRVQGEAERIHKIIGELLDYTRPVDDAAEPVALARVCEQALALLRPQRRFKNVEVERRGLEDVPVVGVGAQRLVQVLVNLLLNAADALGEAGGKVELTARRRDDAVELAVRNDGPAIAAEHREQIFDPFFTTKEPGQGTGLGLAVSQSIVESYGGQLILADGLPTTFLVVLPSWRPDAKTADAD